MLSCPSSGKPLPALPLLSGTPCLRRMVCRAHAGRGSTPEKLPVGGKAVQELRTQGRSGGEVSKFDSAVGHSKAAPSFLTCQLHTRPPPQEENKRGCRVRLEVEGRTAQVFCGMPTASISTLVLISRRESPGDGCHKERSTHLYQTLQTQKQRSMQSSNTRHCPDIPRSRFKSSVCG
jgi:hypothetical protein